MYCCARPGPESSRALCVSVTDDGIGIAAEQIQKLFTSFSQLDSSPARKYDGAGLGLAISKRLCEAMGGGMRAESDGPGRGSTFHFSVALAPAPPPHPPPDPPFLAGKAVLVGESCGPVRAQLDAWLKENWGAAHVGLAATPAGVTALLRRGSGPGEGGAPWDAVIVQSTSAFLGAVAAGCGPSSPRPPQQQQQNHQQQSPAGGGGGGAASGGDAPPPPPRHAPVQPPHSPPPSMPVFALSWPPMPPRPADQFPTSRGGSEGVRAEAAGAEADEAAAAADNAETFPSASLRCAIPVLKPLRQSRLRDALAAALAPRTDTEGAGASAGGSQQQQQQQQQQHAPPHHGGGGGGGAGGGSFGGGAAAMRRSNSSASLASYGGATGAAPAPAGDHGGGGGGGGGGCTTSHAAVPLRVMLAEDHIINQKVVISLLRRYGHGVSCVAHDGLDALERLRATPGGPAAFDTILMDLHMCAHTGGTQRLPFFVLTVTQAAHGRHRVHARHPGGVAAPRHARQCVLARTFISYHFLLTHPGRHLCAFTSSCGDRRRV